MLVTQLHLEHPLTNHPPDKKFCDKADYCLNLASFLITVNSNVIRRSKDNKHDDNFRLEEDDIKMFRGKGVWFYDDKENLVQAILNETLFFTRGVELRKNLYDSVFFKLYTREIKEGYQSLYIHDDFTFSRSNFNPKRPTKFITHGWMNSYLSPACTLIQEGENF